MKSIGQDGFPSKSLFVVTFIILSLTFSIMIVGVYLSSIHQGYSCKTWPLCPNGFGFPPKEYFYEHFHRFLGLILALSLFSFTAFSLVKIRNRNFSIKLSIASTSACFPNNSWMGSNCNKIATYCSRKSSFYRNRVIWNIGSYFNLVAAQDEIIKVWFRDL